MGFMAARPGKKELGIQQIVASYCDHFESD